MADFFSDKNLLDSVESHGLSAEPTRLIGFLPGEGIGPEIINHSIRALDLVTARTGITFQYEFGGKIGKEAIAESGTTLTSGVSDFCDSVFKRKGCVVAGPGGARFVYEMRKQFDLYVKFAPIKPLRSCIGRSAVKADIQENADILVVRENKGGLYFGEEEGDLDSVAVLKFGYYRHEVERILAVAIKAAKQRRSKLCVVIKPGATKGIAVLWERVARDIVPADLELSFLEVDNAAYQLVVAPGMFDVLITSNLFGDILADAAATHLGSRGVSWSANFGPEGAAVYQTGHGAAYDLVGKDKANPMGQLMATAMLLKESFALTDIANAWVRAMDRTAAEIGVTQDLVFKGESAISTQHFVNGFLQYLDSELEQLSAVSGQ